MLIYHPSLLFTVLFLVDWEIRLKFDHWSNLLGVMRATCFA